MKYFLSKKIPLKCMHPTLNVSTLNCKFLGVGEYFEVRVLNVSKTLHRLENFNDDEERKRERARERERKSCSIAVCVCLRGVFALLFVLLYYE